LHGVAALLPAGLVYILLRGGLGLGWFGGGFSAEAAGFSASPLMPHDHDNRFGGRLGFGASVWRCSFSSLAGPRFLAAAVRCLLFGVVTSSINLAGLLRPGIDHHGSALGPVASSSEGLAIGGCNPAVKNVTLFSPGLFVLACVTLEIIVLSLAGRLLFPPQSRRAILGERRAAPDCRRCRARGATMQPLCKAGSSQLAARTARAWPEVEPSTTAIILFPLRRRRSNEVVS